MTDEKKKEPTSGGDTSRRRFLKNCGIGLLATASYQVLSIFSKKAMAAEPDLQDVPECDYSQGWCQSGLCNMEQYPLNDCQVYCTDSCTTSNQGYDAPPVGDPECVQWFNG